MKVQHFVRSVTVLVVVSAFVLFPAPSTAFAKDPEITFELGSPGVDLEEPETLLVAVELINTGLKTAYGVRIDSIELESAELLSPVPILVGQIDAGEGATFQANFNSHLLAADNHYRLGIHGHYETVPVVPAAGKHDDKSTGDSKNNDKSTSDGHTFTLKALITLPPSSMGSATVNSASHPAQQVSGAPFPHQPPNFDEDESNPSGRPIPIGPFVAGTPTPTSTGVQAIPGANIVMGENVLPPVVFPIDHSLGLIQHTDTVAEPSGAAGGGVIFVTANWTAAYSTDGGNTFTQLDPTTIFPNSTDDPFCCDQVVQYVDTIDRFIWLMQTWPASGHQVPNRLRIASASPEDIIRSNGTAWATWDLLPQDYGLGPTNLLDFPDLSVGNHFLYMSVVVFNRNQQGNLDSVGLLVERIPLSQLQGGGMLFTDYTDPAVSSVAVGSHLTQNTGDEIFWAGHDNNSQMRVFSMAEGSNNYAWQDVNISSWSQNDLSSITPDGSDWLDFSKGDHRVLGATRVGNQIWFAWNAGTDSNFPQAHIEMVTLDLTNNFNLVQQVQIWNPDFAFAFPALATNYCTGEVGLSFVIGGGPYFENHVVGFWGDFFAYLTSASTVGPPLTVTPTRSYYRFGDYVTIRQGPRTGIDEGNLFTAFGYGLTTIAGRTVADIHYVLFGRPQVTCQPGI